MQEVADSVGAVGASFIFGALILKLTDFVKYVRNGDGNGIITIVTGWIVGLVSIWLILQTNWADEIKFGDEALSSLNTGSKIVLALVATSVAGVLYDVKKAIDNTDTGKHAAHDRRGGDRPQAGGEQGARSHQPVSSAAPARADATARRQRPVRPSARAARGRPSCREFSK